MWYNIQNPTGRSGITVWGAFQTSWGSWFFAETLIRCHSGIQRFHTEISLYFFNRTLFNAMTFNLWWITWNQKLKMIWHSLSGDMKPVCLQPRISYSHQAIVIPQHQNVFFLNLIALTFIMYVRKWKEIWSYLTWNFRFNQCNICVICLSVNFRCVHTNKSS